MISTLTGAERVTLGRTGISISPIGLGTWQWGDTFYWGYGKGGYSDEDIQSAFYTCVEAGINFYDTAEIYGRGRSETLLGMFAREVEPETPLVITSKFMPMPWRLTRKSLLDNLRRSLDRLGREQLDLYLIHVPLPPVPPEKWADRLADAVDEGLTRAVGVSNFSRKQMGRAYRVLRERGIPLACNQVEYNLLNRAPERNGVLDACRKAGITLVAYSPLAMGMLTGKYTPENPPPGLRGFKYRRHMDKIQDLVGLMREVGEAHGGKTPAQVALNWLVCKGAVPIPGAKNIEQAKQNVGALGWRLTPNEIAALEEASDRAGA